MTASSDALESGPESDIVARVSRPRDKQRIPYAEASRVLLRDSILDGMRELLLTRDWSAITLSASCWEAGPEGGSVAVIGSDAARIFAADATSLRGLSRSSTC